MRNHVRSSRSERSGRTRPAVEEGDERGSFALAPDDAPDAEATADGTYDTDADTAVDADTDTDSADELLDEDLGDLGDVLRLRCPDCGQPIAVFAEEDRLPEHALCPTPWNPFGLTVCGGSGRAVADALPLDGEVPGQEQEMGALLALPAGLDWRTQPFSHVGGPGSRPRQVPAPGLAA
jgi:hypothetical protein